MRRPPFLCAERAALPRALLPQVEDQQRLDNLTGQINALLARAAVSRAARPPPPAAACRRLQGWIRRVGPPPPPVTAHPTLPLLF